MSDSSRSGAEYFVSALESYGVERLFGNPGTTELPVVQAVGDSSIEYVLGLHEDVAVGMASGYARTRRYHSHEDEDVNPLGVVNLHVAPGLAHGIGNLIGAKFAGSPLLVTAGNHSTSFQHEEPILGGRLEEMVEQYTKWSAEVKHVDALPTMLRRAVRVALTPPTGPVFLSLPLDVVLAETDAEVAALGSIPTAGQGDPDVIEAAATILADADEPVLVVGDEIARAGASESVVALAEATGARVHGEFISGEVNVPTDHPQWASLLPGSEDAHAEMLDTDTVVYVGVSSNTTSIAHEQPLVSPDTRTVHVSPDSRELGKNVPADVSIVGDVGLVSERLTERVSAAISTAEREARLERTAAEIERLRASNERVDVEPDDPRASKSELGLAMSRAADGALLADEAVTSGKVIREMLSLSPTGMIRNKSGGLGYGLPAAVGAAIAERERPEPRDVVALIGDGSYLYYPQAIYSAARYDVDLTVVVADNRNYRILKNNTMRVLGGTEDDHEFVAMDFDPPVDITKSAESHGAASSQVDDPDDIESAIRRARAEGGPTVLDVLVHD